ncbi:MAG: hypothetical protein IPL97_11805 [Niastella sp.]|nr:hypothetical protein [Niastella sp.]
MKPIIYLLLFIVTHIGCVQKKIKITSAYIINPHWDEQANAIKITKQKVKKDSLLNPFKKLPQSELQTKLENDTSFLYVGNVKYNGEKYTIRKVYFNSWNGFFWWSNRGEIKTKTIGNLEKGNWYKFSQLVTYPYYVFVYVDSSNNLHRFDVNEANF